MFEAEKVRPLPRTVAVRWPDLIRGTCRYGGSLVLVLDPRVLMGVVEVRLGKAPEARKAP